MEWEGEKKHLCKAFFKFYSLSSLKLEWVVGKCYKADAFKNPTTKTSFMLRENSEVLAHLTFVYCGFQFSKIFWGYWKKKHFSELNDVKIVAFV